MSLSSCCGAEIINAIGIDGYNYRVCINCRKSQSLLPDKTEDKDKRIKRLQDEYDALLDNVQLMEAQVALGKELMEAMKSAIKVTMRTSEGNFPARLDETYKILNDALTKAQEIWGSK